MNTDPKQIAAWLARIVSPGFSVELRILFDKRAPIVRHYQSDQLDDLAVDAIHHGDGSRGVYVTLNPLPSGFKGRAAKDADIICRRWLLIDCDPVRPADVSASDAEKLAAEEKCFAVATFLESLDWPVPIIAGSGNGSHLLYRLPDLTADDGGLVARVLKALAVMFSDAAVSIDTKVANASRICKLYGTMSRKGPDTPERPHRASSVVSMPDDELKPVPVELLEALARSGEQPPVPVNFPEQVSGKGEENLPQGDRIGRASKYLQAMDAAVSGERGSDKLLRACSVLVNDFDLPDEEAFGLLMTEYNPRCVPPWEEKDVQRKLSEARKNVPVRASKAERSPSSMAVPSFATGAGQPPYVGFPTDALPDVLRQFVELGAAALCCDPSYLALPMLAVCGAALGNAVRLRLKPGWLACPLLWTAIVGESGTAKTPAFRAVLEPVRRRQHLMIRAGADAEAEHAKELQFYKRNLAAWERERQSSNEPPIPPVAPVVERLLIEDTTVEAVAPILAANPRGLLLARDELSGWFGSFDRYSSGKGDSAQWLSMYNAETLVVDRKTGTPRTISVQNAALSICGGIQPGILRRALGSEHRESGLAARFLLAYPPRKPKQWTEAGISPELSKTWADVVDWLYSIPVAMNEDGEQCPHVLDLEPEAKRLFVAFYGRHAVEQAGLSGDLAAVWSKLEEAVGRLALILHFARLGSRDGRASHGLVDAASVSSAVRLVEWFKREAQRVYAMFHEVGGETAENDKLAKLVEWIRRKGGTVTAREVRNCFRSLRAADAAENALNSLAADGVGTWSDSATERTKVFTLLS